MNRKLIRNGAVAATAAVMIVACTSDSSDSSSGSSSYAGPGSHYTFARSGSTFSINKYTNRADSTADFSVTATSADYSTGFKELTVSAVSGIGGPTVGDKVFALEVPGIALFMKPIASGSDQVLAAMSAGTCPTSNFDANWVIVKRASTNDVSSNTQDIYGTFSYNSSTGVASLPARYSLDNDDSNLGANTFASATCSNGVMAVDNGGGDTAVMYLTSAGAALVNTAEDTSADAQYILGMPAGSVSGSGLAGTYAGIVFSEADATSKVQPFKMVLTWNGSAIMGTGSKYTDVATGTLAGGSVTLHIPSINDPSNGLLTGTMTGGATTNIACMAVENVGSSGKTTMNCAGRDPGDATQLFNFIMVK